MTTTHPREASRPRARRLLSRLAAAIVVGTLAFGGASAASADDETDAPTPADPIVRLSVSTGSGTPTAPGGPLVSTITITNDTSSPLSAGTVSLQVGRDALADGEALDQWLDDDATSGPFHTLASEATPVIDREASGTVNVVVDAVELGDLDAGVYPVRARLSGASTQVSGEDALQWNLTASTVLVIADSTARNSAVLVPITATPENGSLLTADELSALTTEGGALAGQLNAVSGTTAVLAIDPAIPAAIRILGTRAPETATRWLSELEALPNDVFALQFGDADATVQARAGLPAPLATPDLTSLLLADDFPPAADATPTPSPTPTADPVAALPDNEQLTALNGAEQGLLWPRSDVTAADLAVFGDYFGEDVTTILPSTSFIGDPAGRVTVDGHDALVVDATASARLSAAVEATDPAVLDRELTAAAGHMFFATGGATPTILALDRSETRSPSAVRAALSAFASPAVTLSELRAAPPSSATPTRADSIDRVPGLNAMLADEERLTEFATILTEPAQLLSPTRIRILRTIGVGFDDTAFTAAVATQQERARTTLDAVGIQQPKPVQLFTSAAPLPVWVRNDLPWDVNLSLFSTPSDLRLDIQPVTEVAAQPAGSTRVDIPIEARVASGDVQVTFRLTSPTGVPIGQTATADVTLRADWEGIGLGILGGVIALLLVLGTIRTVRRRRTQSDAADEAEPATDDAGER
ncbi:DUF6049 family protein [Microbacterium esteraromaticum]|uniref:DUF6049 family protein n=1 Tax=Microbacterium esteraromaticum TaxID=57043 RepID=UPI002368B7A1|nr:DUF6049 family protein [Microbacterium esteraromaticum]WDH78848.1 DUF6049 family protein [Microbacterium esteraromaticum]